MAGKQVVLYKWPESEICLDCASGLGIINYRDIDGADGPSTICLENCSENFERHSSNKCPEFTPADEGDDTGFDLAGMVSDDCDGDVENGDDNGI